MTPRQGSRMADHYIETLVLDHFIMAIYLLLPAALPNNCDTKNGWDKKWTELLGKFSSSDSIVIPNKVMRKPNLPKTIVWSFVLGNQKW
jgi:hypothetical protein